MNTRYVIDGGIPLKGSVALQGAKNAITKQLVASLLTEEPCTFTNVPRSKEVEVVLSMLVDAGTQYEWQGSDKLVIQTEKIKNADLGIGYSGANRIPILMLGPLLHRAGQASVPAVGGCVIGARPVDFHLTALSLLGATVQETEKGYHASAKKLTGKVIQLPYPSVGATENVLITAVLASGRTTILNAAIEPEILDTILFLQKMGALVHIDVDRKIIIEGVDRLHGATHKTIPDRIEAASYAIAALATNGRIEVLNARQVDMISLLNVLRKIGGTFDIGEDGITFYRGGKHLSQIHMETDVFPGFSTDWQPVLGSLLTAAHGVSVIHETVYEQRFGYTEALQRMGATISLVSDCLGAKRCRFVDQNHLHSCVIQGPSALAGISMHIPDLRAGFAYVIGALMAEGKSELLDVGYLERGYADVGEKLKSLGAKIEIY